MGVTKAFCGRGFLLVRYSEAIVYLKSHVGSSSFVRCPESRSVRFSEVALVLQLRWFQSVTRSLSVIERLSASRRVRYRRLDCICVIIANYNNYYNNIVLRSKTAARWVFSFFFLQHFILLSLLVPWIKKEKTEKKTKQKTDIINFYTECHEWYNVWL